MAELAFDTTVNYQKIYMEGSASLSVTSPSIKATTTITHSLGYIPNVRVWFTNASGGLSPAAGEIIYQLTGSSDYTYHTCRYKINTTTLTLILDCIIAPPSTKSSTVYYRIYYDGA